MIQRTFVRVSLFSTLIAATLLLGGCQFFNAPQQTDTTRQNANTNQGDTMAKSVIVNLDAQNNSGQSGQATLSDEAGKTKVAVSVPAGGDGVAQPAHIHAGACPEPGGIVYPLSNVVNGNSKTTLDVSLEDLLEQLPLAINIHKSANQVSVYTSCGDIVTEAMVEEDSIINDTLPENEEMIADDTDTTMDQSANATINLTAKNFEFSQKEIRVKLGDTVKVVLTSEQGFHDFVIEEFDAATEQINQGQTSEVTFVADQSGTFEYYCSVGSHRQMGMVGTLIVE